MPEARQLAEHAADKLRLSPRGFTRALRVARSIADLAGASAIRRQDVAEALAFRHRMPGRQRHEPTPWQRAGEWWAILTGDMRPKHGSAASQMPTTSR